MNILLAPAALFTLLLVFSAVLSYLFSLLSFKKAGTKSSGKPYACGEEHYDVYAQPDYSVFFPFAFFFTIAHVATLIIASIPFITVPIAIMAGLYIVTMMTGLFILLWR